VRFNFRFTWYMPGFTWHTIFVILTLVGCLVCLQNIARCLLHCWWCSLLVGFIATTFFFVIFGAAHFQPFSHWCLSHVHLWTALSIRWPCFRFPFYWPRTRSRKHLTHWMNTCWDWQFIINESQTRLLPPLGLEVLAVDFRISSRR